MMTKQFFPSTFPSHVTKILWFMSRTNHNRMNWQQNRMQIQFRDMLRSAPIEVMTTVSAISHRTSPPSLLFTSPVWKSIQSRVESRAWESWDNRTLPVQIPSLIPHSTSSLTPCMHVLSIPASSLTPCIFSHSLTLLSLPASHWPYFSLPTLPTLPTFSLNPWIFSHSLILTSHFYHFPLLLSFPTTHSPLLTPDFSHSPLLLSLSVFSLNPWFFSHSPLLTPHFSHSPQLTPHNFSYPTSSLNPSSLTSHFFSHSPLSHFPLLLSVCISFSHSPYSRISIIQ